jgi:phospholipase C
MSMLPQDLATRPRSKLATPSVSMRAWMEAGMNGLPLKMRSAVPCAIVEPWKNGGVCVYTDFALATVACAISSTFPVSWNSACVKITLLSVGVLKFAVSPMKLPSPPTCRFALRSVP